MNFFILIIYIFFFLPLNPALAFDIDYDAYIKTGSQYIFDSPSLHKDFDSDLQIHLGLEGNVLKKNKWALDYEIDTHLMNDEICQKYLLGVGVFLLP